ncbi:MAG: hypothetical protein ACR5LA_07255 [Wolbachia sp.]
MPRPYSEDLRDRVLKAVSEKTMTIKKISQVFKVIPILTAEQTDRQ